MKNILDQLENLTYTAAAIEANPEMTRRGLFIAAKNAAQRAALQNEVIDNVRADILPAGQMPEFPFQNVNVEQIVLSLEQQKGSHIGLDAVYDEAISKVKSGFLTQNPHFAVGNHTWYASNGLWRTAFNNQIGYRNPEGIPERMLDQGLVVAPNPVYFVPELWDIYGRLRDEALANTGLTLDALRSGAKFPTDAFQALIGRNSREITHYMKQALNKHYLCLVMQPNDGTYFQEGPYWKSNSADIKEKNSVGWGVPYAQIVYGADLKAMHHIANVTPELTGERQSNFVGDFHQMLTHDLSNFRNHNHRPLTVLAAI